ncbi:MAG: cupin domain-containing protein [Pseudomonadota bacterium]
MFDTAISRAPETLKAFKISEADTNYFACLADPLEDGVPFTIVVEIYQPGGATPPNTHQKAIEFFYILAGEGIGHCGGVSVDLKPGSTLMLPPGNEHIVENTGAGKLYALCVMVPNEDFAEMIRGGIPVDLTPDDIAILKGAPGMIDA